MNGTSGVHESGRRRSASKINAPKSGRRKRSATPQPKSVRKSNNGNSLAQTFANHPLPNVTTPERHIHLGSPGVSNYIASEHAAESNPDGKRFEAYGSRSTSVNTFITLIILSFGLSVLCVIFLETKMGRSANTVYAEEAEAIHSIMQRGDTRYEPNLLSAEMGAKVIEFQLLSRESDLRSTKLSEATLNYALNPNSSNPDYCWWLPGPSGSGFIKILLPSCMKSSLFTLENNGPKDLWPSRVSLWTNGSMLAALDGQLRESKESVSANVCFNEVSIIISGTGRSQHGSCIYRLALLKRVSKGKKQLIPSKPVGEQGSTLAAI